MPRGVYNRKNAKKAGKASTSRDALIYLQHAERRIIERIRTTKVKSISLQDLLTLLALESLRGKNEGP